MCDKLLIINVTAAKIQLYLQTTAKKKKKTLNGAFSSFFLTFAGKKRENTSATTWVLLTTTFIYDNLDKLSLVVQVVVKKYSVVVFYLTIIILQL